MRENVLKLFLSILLLSYSLNSFGFVQLQRSFIIDFDLIKKGSESALDFYQRIHGKFNSNFSKNKNDFTYNFLENYFQNYSNIPLGVKDKEVILSCSYDVKNDVVNAKSRFHFMKGDEVKELNIKAKIKVRKTDHPTNSPESKITFEIKNDFEWAIRQLIKLYLQMGDGDRVILDFTTTTVSVSQKHSNALKIDIDYSMYGNSVKQFAIDGAIEHLIKVTQKTVAGLRN